MLKRDKVDELYSVAIRRYREEYPDKELGENLLIEYGFLSMEC